MSSSVPLNTAPPQRRILVTNERVTGPPAAELLRRSKIAETSTAGLDVLDNATGGGILVSELLKLAAEHRETVKINRIVAGDKDHNMVKAAGETKREALEAGLNGWARVEILDVDQQAIPSPDATFTHVFANFGIFFCPDDEKALAETYRVLKSGGTAGFTSWKSIAWWSEIAQPAIKQFVPDAPELPSPNGLFPSTGWTDPDAIPGKLQKAGFEDVEVTDYRFTPDVSPEAFAEATGVLIKVVAQRLWPSDLTAKYADRIQPAILHYLRENYKEGRWDGQMTAIITVGKKP